MILFSLPLPVSAPIDHVSEQYLQLIYKRYTSICHVVVYVYVFKHGANILI
jgi:hypothetical protein